MVYTTVTKHPNGLRLLSLDGGGVRGIMGLVVLRELILRIQKRKGLNEMPRPADYFELAGGTSTGGIIGIMLFRLRITVDDTIADRFDAASISKAVHEVVEKYGLNKNDKKLKGNAPLQHKAGAQI
ncbi:hypothetical protein NW762_013846 [Fusarium torreyae]|uniref:PNPLA domain-containing protein n=1 Tax=Fusarium torreyae TaxID=1237075 RepID=A0A9W8V9V5_9HYPO|nr:hypothetical protein NW762_013846 [Fusarium torreyae]